ncbi:hypothetical protein OK348_01125 [Flavobacterium sp. MXW15]|uniref:Uncharacterized protein n=1 Tax=Xanthomonas chitinilytica TaxID=2989819 RepID=A0ABT3JUR6_9XANT|nr:hypothetical protein [Xanthomonas sp. H13-6]MCW4453405.1 hypothetical protein [Flavobacterium sp. MXW15]MCW4472242.1 hypothetical protein [Xanthomonas sp. H13-6]
MKTASIVSSLFLLCASAPALAQATADCPSLPGSAGLQWERQVQNDFILCKASTEDGRHVLNMMLTSRDPALPLNRSLRQEKGSFAGESLYWYTPDMGGRDLPGLEARRITVVKLAKNRYAQIWIDAGDTRELSSLQSLTQGMNLNPTALAGGN